MEAFKRERDEQNSRLNGKADRMIDCIIDSLEYSALMEAPVAPQDSVPPPFFICPISHELMTDPVLIP